MTGTLFDRIGGYATVSRLVMDFYERVLESEELAGYFANVDMRRLVEHQAKFISAVMGGPASYTDQELREIHSHLKIDERSFDTLAEIFAATVTDYVTDPADATEVVAMVRARKIHVVRPAA
ncbi:MAG TPA: group 1 truncated hemoglobin [Methylomirabilota bacterium]|nr:group 1 truncated hemoglobin [Methylomirabilota bacterium]